MRFKPLLTALLLGFFCVTTVQATVVKDLYSAKLMVPDQSQAAWDKALPNALIQVLIKLSGNPAIGQNAIIKAALPKASLWVKSYSYHERWQNDQSELWLRFDFDEASVNKLMQQAHQSKWSSDRPLTLMWLELDQGEHKIELVDAQNSLNGIIQQNAERRGLPVLFPADDLNDQEHLSLNLANPANWEWAFSQYGVKAILVGQLKYEDQKWQAHWLVIANGDSKQWETAPAELSELIALNIDQATDWMAQQSIVGNDPNAKVQKVNLQVADVQDLGDYAKISNYLNQLAPIRHVSLGGVSSSGMNFELQVAGSSDQLIKVLSNSTELVPDESEHTNTKNTLYYRWAQATKAEATSNEVQEVTQ